MKKSVAIAGATFTIEATRQGEDWHAEARGDDGERFGPPRVDRDADRAIGSVERWLVWQRDHDEKLRALQNAEQIYHRTIAGSAFARSSDSAALQADALSRLDAARLALDAARRRKPE